MLWSGLFLRWVIDQSPAEKVWAEMGAMRERETELRRKAMKLRKELLDLEKKVQENEPIQTDSVDGNGDS